MSDSRISRESRLQPSPWPHRLAGVLLAVACLWPARDSALLTGLPLSPLGIAVCTVFAIGWLAAPVRLTRATTVVALGATLALLVVKIAVASMVMPSGWAARYYDNEQFAGAPERSIEFRGEPWTRLERRLQFEANSFPLHFLNELHFNFSPQRRGQPFSATYQGYVFVDRPGTLRATVATMNGVDLRVDGTPLLSRETAASQGRTHERLTATLPLAVGTHRIDVRYAVLPFTAPKLDVMLDVDGVDLTPRVRPVETSAAHESRARWLSWTLTIVDIILLAAAAAWLWRALQERLLGHGVFARPGTLIVIGVMGIIGVWLAARYGAAPASFFIISSGADGLAYSHYARTAILHSWLLNSGPTAGVALFYTIGYHGTMSLASLVLGESMISLLFFQDWLFWATVALTTGAAWRLAGWKAGAIAALIGLYFKWYLFWPATYPFRENLVVFLNATLIFAVMKAGPVDARRAAAIGTITGYNYITDPINLLVIPIVAWFVYDAAAREQAAGQRRWSLLAFAVGVSVFFLLVPIRNVIVAGQPILLPTEGAATLWWGNMPPPGIYDNPGLHHEFYAAVWRYALSEPWLFAAGIIRKIGYSFGLYWTLMWQAPEFNQLSLILLIAWICAALGLGEAWRRSRGTVVVAALVLIRWASIVVFIANHNGDRYEVALAMLLLPLSVVGLMRMWQWHKLLPVLAVLTLAVDHYVRVSPETANYSAFTGARLLSSPSYQLGLRNLEWQAPRDMRLRWTFPADTALWGGEATAVVDDETPTYVSLRPHEFAVESPALAVPAPLVKDVEIEAGFTGFYHVAQVVWHRQGIDAPLKAYFKVDQTGRMKTYRIPVSRSGDWNGVIERVSIVYEGDSIAPRRIELMTYPRPAPRRR